MKWEEKRENWDLDGEWEENWLFEIFVGNKQMWSNRIIIIRIILKFNKFQYSFFSPLFPRLLNTFISTYFRYVVFPLYQCIPPWFHFISLQFAHQRMREKTPSFMLRSTAHHTTTKMYFVTFDLHLWCDKIILYLFLSWLAGHSVGSFNWIFAFDIYPTIQNLPTKCINWNCEPTQREKSVKYTTTITINNTAASNIDNVNDIQY